MNGANDVRELRADELDTISGAEIRLYDFTIFGHRFLGGITDSGYVYSCHFNTNNGTGGCR